MLGYIAGSLADLLLTKKLFGGMSTTVRKTTSIKNSREVKIHMQCVGYGSWGTKGPTDTVLLPAKSHVKPLN